MTADANPPSEGQPAHVRPTVTPKSMAADLAAAAQRRREHDSAAQEAPEARALEQLD